MVKTNWFDHIKAAWEEIGGKRIYLRSKLEKHCAVYLQSLKSKGMIIDWAYEPKTFWFEAIKRGVRSYKPDFLVTMSDGSTVWIECKGYMDAKSKTKLKRFAKYYPDERIVVWRERIKFGSGLI